jgi:hypothetical protein
MVELQPSKLIAGVRFPLPAPLLNGKPPELGRLFLIASEDHAVYPLSKWIDA